MYPNSGGPKQCGHPQGGIAESFPSHDLASRIQPGGLRLDPSATHGKLLGRASGGSGGSQHLQQFQRQFTIEGRIGQGAIDAGKEGEAFPYWTPSSEQTVQAVQNVDGKLS